MNFNATMEFFSPGEDGDNERSLEEATTGVSPSVSGDMIGWVTV